ncbi:MAG: DUF87 domain-containing protein [Nitrososphaerota archaeon]|nr:DUF87 domain-containing protein [Nitrososphaerota archaeon]
MLEEFHIEPLQNRRTLIIGEVGSGKSYLTSMLLWEAFSKLSKKDITILDFAPHKKLLNGLLVGGQLDDVIPLGPDCIYYKSKAIRAPRLEGLNKQNVRELAERNAQYTTKFIRMFLSSPTPYLFINDLTMHLHAGSIKLLNEAIQKSGTFIASAYSGSILTQDHGSGISKRERELLDIVISIMDVLIDLSP